jgi:hypothetical protein
VLQNFHQQLDAVERIVASVGNERPAAEGVGMQSSNQENTAETEQVRSSSSNLTPSLRLLCTRSWPTLSIICLKIFLLWMGVTLGSCVIFF